MSATIGASLPRPDGFAKVTGAARYAADQRVDGMLHGVIVGAPVAAGRLLGVDVAAAVAVNGVTVLTHSELPRLGDPPSMPAASMRLPMQDDEIHYQGEPIAVVLGETLEDARFAASLVQADVEPATFTPHPRPEHAGAVEPDRGGYLFFDAAAEHGDFDAAMDEAATQQEVTYVQPSRHPNPIEPSATLAWWTNGELEIEDAVQHVYGVQQVMAAVFDLAPERIRVRSRHTGGGFGCKGMVFPHQILAAVAARVAGRPVRIALTRAQMYSIVSYQPQTVQTIMLGAGADGRLLGVGHETVNVTSIDDDYVEYACEASQSSYAAAAIRTRQRVQRAHVNIPNPMRSPAEGCGIWALGGAMNELADRLGRDPVELRLANYAETHPATGKPWSSKKLRECYEDGARAFGWRRRPCEPDHDGPWLVGHGMSDCTFGAYTFPSQARIRLLADGSAVVESGFQDIGTGSLTIFPQIAADVLGLELGMVRTEMGDTTLPEAGPTYGSSSAMSTGAAVQSAARDLLAKLSVHVGRDLSETPGAGALAEALAASGLDELVGEGSFTPEWDGPYANQTFGAIFVEVGVDPELGLVRLRRAVARYSVGRVMNPRTAKSQMIGGIVWGWGKATMEMSPHDQRLGHWVSKNLAGVALPVNADIPADIDVGFIDEVDEHASPLGGKGIGELGATGIDVAVADAVFHATGKRIRELPITPDKLVHR